MILFRSFSRRPISSSRAILLYAAEVETQNNFDDLSVVDDRQMPVAALFHPARRFVGVPAETFRNPHALLAKDRLFPSAPVRSAVRENWLPILASTNLLLPRPGRRLLAGAAPANNQNSTRFSRSAQCGRLNCISQKIF